MPGRRRPANSRFRAAALAPAAGMALVAGVITGCGVAQPPGPTLSLLSAQVTEPNNGGITDAYVIVQNKGPAVSLIGARTSAGGRVALRLPGKTGMVVMRTVPSIVIPAHSLFRLDPSGAHLLITGSGPMKAGTEITLTLVFASAGSVSAPAMVTNPSTGGASYFLN